MHARTESNPTIFPGFQALDDLELIRWGVLPDDWPLAATLPDLGNPGESSTTTVLVTDAEGAPYAEVAASEGQLDGATARWVGRRSARPFEALHRGPADVAPGPVVTMAHPTPSDVLDEAVAAQGTILLCLASLDGEPDPVSLATVRQAQEAAGRHAGLTVVVAPVSREPRVLDARRDTVASAYGRGHEVTHLPPGNDGHDATPSGTVLFFTGLSGSGKSTIARQVRNHLLEQTDAPVTLLDGDIVRRNLSQGLGFSAADRDTNIRRIGWVAAEIAHHGGLAICSPIAPFAQTREAVRAMVEERGGRFVLVHVATPLEECERRDRKGLYAKARRGEIPEFTGISSPYEAPTDADLVLDTTGERVEDLRDRVLDLLVSTRPAGAREAAACSLTS